MERAKADRLIAELGTKLGVADLALDDSGGAGLLIDDAVFLRIAVDEATGGFDIFAPLGGIAPSPANLARALSASFCWRPAGGTFGLDPTRNELVLQRHCPGADLDAAGLLQALEGVVAQAEAGMKALGGIEPAEPVSEKAERMPIGGGLRG